MDSEKKTELINMISNCASSPGELIRKVMAIGDMSKQDLARKLHTSTAYISMVISDYNLIGTKAALRFSNILNIDPFILNRLAADMRMKELIKREEFENQLRKKMPKNKREAKEMINILVNVISDRPTHNGKRNNL